MKNRSLKFYYSKYLVTDIEKMIENCPGINNFVFSFYSGKPTGYMQLIVYAQMSKETAKNEYSSFTETLKPFRSQALEINGPVILSNNYISIEAMRLLLASSENDEAKPDYLVFTPALDASNHIYYTITSYQEDPEGDKLTETETPPVITNPSPPATMPVV